MDMQILSDLHDETVLGLQNSGIIYTRNLAVQVFRGMADHVFREKAAVFSRTVSLTPFPREFFPYQRLAVFLFDVPAKSIRHRCRCGKDVKG